MSGHACIRTSSNTGGGDMHRFGLQTVNTQEKTSCATCFVCCRSVQCCTDVGHAGIAWLLTFSIYCALPCFCLKCEDLSNTAAAHFPVWSWGSWTRFAFAQAWSLLHLIRTLPEYTKKHATILVSTTDGQSLLCPGQDPWFENTLNSNQWHEVCISLFLSLVLSLFLCSYPNSGGLWSLFHLVFS